MAAGSTSSVDAFDKRTLWIGSIPPRTGPSDLHDALKQVAEAVGVEDIRMIHRNSDDAKCCAIARFGPEEAARRSLLLTHDHWFFTGQEEAAHGAARGTRRT